MQAKECGAKTRAGTSCRGKAMANGRCRMHGGNAAIGPAAGGWIDGRKSKIMPKRLLASYQASLNNPDKLALNEEIAILDARLEDVLQRVDDGESGQLWRKVQHMARDYEVARRANDSVSMAQILDTMLELIHQGATDVLVWAEVRQLIQERRKVVESEGKRLVQQREMISAEASMTLLAQLVDAVKHHVHDDDTLRAIATEYRRLIGA